MLNTVGAVEVSEMTARRVTLRAGKESWRFATHELAGLVRPVASDVDAVLRSLGEAAPDERSVNERTFDYSQLIDSGSFAERARAYAELRRDEQKVMGGEHYRWKLKELVVGEIAAAKGTTQRKSAALLAQTLDPTARRRARPDPRDPRAYAAGVRGLSGDRRDGDRAGDRGR
jgi:hypothetical protein